MTSGLPCPCGIAARGVLEATDPAQAIAAYEHAALHALAVGAQLDADRHATDDTATEQAGELNLIARQLRTAHAHFEQHLADAPPQQSTPARRGDELRFHARALTQIAARLYRHAARENTRGNAPPAPAPEPPRWSTGT
ncbi:hypothetical protein H4696_003427 [Amycolatopsis lexingtonensis]|uniref:Uncharacterized protein n=1 Tax=Amycolatopsis lexingtonensis TaxID=218822 RepID=A0ABR9I064_9PSEU|nr:hypothetical protein [Amycolatopsis lexingtonensis]MBE1496327.1 hypothetical protein [Amycolatopsis lexingtonensis]